MNFKWLFSRTVRLAGDMSKHVRKLLDAQRDILSPQAVGSVETALRDTREAVANGANDDSLKKQLGQLEAAANKWLKPYPHAAIRENVEVLLVALAVAMGIRTFFLQPFKIPTGSMQPTLFGIVSDNMKGQAGARPPGPLMRVYDALVHGTFYHHLTADAEGQIVSIGPVEHVLRFINKNTIFVRYVGRSDEVPYTFWFTPEDHFTERAGVSEGETFHKGDDIVNFRETSGDHLFVDRISYNFRHPKRGEIIVFETHGIGNQYGMLPQDQFYIKRMVALGGERVQLGTDRHLIIDGKRLDKSTPHFENVYSFDPNQPPRESHYSGHVDGPRLAPLFTESADGVVTVRPDHYMVMGDNTMNSYDSRAWGDFSRTNVIGKYFFVYWPVSKRFGWGAR